MKKVILLIFCMLGGCAQMPPQVDASADDYGLVILKEKLDWMQRHGGDQSYFQY